MKRSLPFILLTLLSACGGDSSSESQNSTPSSPEVGEQVHPLYVSFSNDSIVTKVIVSERISEQSLSFEKGISTFQKSLKHGEQYKLMVEPAFSSVSCTANPSNGTITEPTHVEITCSDSLVYGTHPELLNIQQISSDSVEITWIPVAGKEVSYNVYAIPLDEHTTPYLHSPKITLKGDKNNTSVISGLDTSRRYVYRIEAVVDQESLFSEEVQFTTYPEIVSSGQDYLELSKLNRDFSFEFDEKLQRLFVTPLHSGVKAETLLGRNIMLDAGGIRGLHSTGVYLEAIAQNFGQRSILGKSAFTLTRWTVKYVVSDGRREFYERFTDELGYSPRPWSQFRGISAGLHARPHISYDYVVSGMIDIVDGEFSNETFFKISGDTSVGADFSFEAAFSASANKKFTKEWYNLPEVNRTIPFGNIPVKLTFGGGTYSSAELKSENTFELIYARTMGLNLSSDFKVQVEGNKYLSSFSTDTKPYANALSAINVDGSAGITANLLSAKVFVRFYDLVEFGQDLGLQLDSNFATKIYGDDALSVEELTIEGKVNCATGVGVNNTDWEMDKNWCDTEGMTAVLHKQAELKVDGLSSSLKTNEPVSLTLNISEDELQFIDESSIRWFSEDPNVLINDGNLKTATLTFFEPGVYDIYVYVDHKDAGESLRKIHQFFATVGENACPHDSEIEADISYVPSRRIEKRADGDFCDVSIYNNPEPYWQAYQLRYHKSLLQELTEFYPTGQKKRFERHESDIHPDTHQKESYMVFEQLFAENGLKTRETNFIPVPRRNSGFASAKHGYSMSSILGGYKLLKGHYLTVTGKEYAYDEIRVGEWTENFSNNKINVLQFGAHGIKCKNGSTTEELISKTSESLGSDGEIVSRTTTQYQMHNTVDKYYSGCPTPLRMFETSEHYSGIEPGSSESTYELVFNNENLIVGSLPTVSRRNYESSLLGTKFRKEEQFKWVYALTKKPESRGDVTTIEEALNDKYYAAYPELTTKHFYSDNGELYSVGTEIKNHAFAGESLRVFSEKQLSRRAQPVNNGEYYVTKKEFSFDAYTPFGYTGYLQTNGVANSFTTQPHHFVTTPYVFNENATIFADEFLKQGTSKYYQHSKVCGSLEYQNGLKHGYYKAEYPCEYGEKAYGYGQGAFENDLLQGAWTDLRYYSDGSLMTEGEAQYEEGKQVGKYSFRTYGENGKLSSEGTWFYEKGKKHGHYDRKAYYENGQLSEHISSNYFNDRLHGKWQTDNFCTKYGSSMRETWTGNYNMGKKEGSFHIKIYSDGKLSTYKIYNYKDDREVSRDWVDV